MVAVQDIEAVAQVAVAQAEATAGIPLFGEMAHLGQVEVRELQALMAVGEVILVGRLMLRVAGEEEDNYQDHPVRVAQAHMHRLAQVQVKAEVQVEAVQDILK